MTSLKVDIRNSPYQVMIGVGGIGSGTFFAIQGNQTLGREESRSGNFLDRRDYCKLHIISHYVKTLMGEDFLVLPIGRLGEDPVGSHLMDEMAGAGLDLRYVRRLPGTQTLYSFCFLYPDGSGGNLTTNNSASDLLEEDSILEAELDFAAFKGRGIALAAPEVPITTRQALLQMGKKHDFLCVASFTSGEIPEVIRLGILKDVDLLALNRDEAAALLQDSTPAPESSLDEMIAAASSRLQHLNTNIHFTITAGAHGSWSWDGTNLRHLAAYPAKVVGSAGAGDAFLAGVIAGLTSSLSLAQAHELGALTAAEAVSSPHTIDLLLDARSLAKYARNGSIRLANSIWDLLPGD